MLRVLVVITNSVTTLVSVGSAIFEVFTAVLMKICSVLASEAWSLGKYFPTFRRIIVPLSSGSNIPGRKSRLQQSNSREESFFGSQ